MKRNPLLYYIVYGLAAIIFSISFIYFLGQALHSLYIGKTLSVEIGTAFLNSLISALLSGTSQYLKNTVRNSRQARQLWKLENPQNCAICLSAHRWTQPLSSSARVRIRYGVGEGQIQALPHIITSLHHAYGDRYAWGNIYQAHNLLASAAYIGDEDLILIGGPFTNPLTKRIISDVRNRISIQPFTNDELTITISAPAVTSRHIVERDTVMINGIYPIITDYAIILRVTQQSDTRNRRVILIAGCNTHSTGAAARHFCHRLQSDRRWRTLQDKDYVAIIECHVNAHQQNCAQTNLVFIHEI